MEFIEIIGEINRLLAASPYSREEIAAFWKAEDEKEWEPETLYAYAAAMEYLHKHGNIKEAENIRGSYKRRLDELEKFYLEREPAYRPKFPIIKDK